MSHRHGDHTGGLNYLLSVNANVTIYAPKENFGVFGSSLPGTFYRRNESLPAEMRYFDGEPPEILHFGTPWPQGQFTWLSETTEVAPDFHLIVLRGQWGVDLDVMEISLAIDTPNGIVLVVGCSHPTIEKIVEAAMAAIGKPIHLVIGGLHLLPANDDETQRIATALHDTWKVEWLAPVHCTGEPAFEILNKTFGDRYLYAGLGTTVPLGRNPAGAAAEHGSRTFSHKADLQPYRAPRSPPYEIAQIRVRRIQAYPSISQSVRSSIPQEPCSHQYRGSLHGLALDRNRSVDRQSVDSYLQPVEI